MNTQTRNLRSEKLAAFLRTSEDNVMIVVRTLFAIFLGIIAVIVICLSLLMEWLIGKLK